MSNTGDTVFEEDFLSVPVCNNCIIICLLILPWPTKSELRCAYYGRNKARIFNGAIDSANLKKFTLNQLHLLAKWKRKM
jgi:hypothetical protein